MKVFLVCVLALATGTFAQVKTVEKQSGLSTVTTVLANKKCQIVNILGWKKDVLLPHWNCDNFFQCANGVAVQRVCPSGLLFNVATDTCDYPQNVKCFRQNHADDQSSADDRSLATALADSKCLVANVLGVKNDVLFAHWDCDKYYICDNGAAVARPCPAGLHFNTFTDRCDYPQNVLCLRSSAIVKSTKSVEKQSGLSTVTTALANKKCQIVNILGWKKDVLLPHWNCDNFFQCANGVAVQRVCPSGLLFNVATDTCDYPQNVKCFRQNHADDQSSADDRSLATALADSKCLVANVLGVKNDVLFAHWDCDKYYICDNGAAVARPCPAGLHFNTFTDRCDYPQNVLCLRSSAIVKSTKSVEKQSGLSTVTTALANKKCQIVNILGWKKDVLLPHWNCDNFFQCANGVAVQRVCPSGLLFNVATDTCDYPQNVKCFRQNHADDQSSADDRSLATALADSKCLVANVLGVKNDVLFAHWDCDKYYICDNGAAVARPCPAGLHFNTFTDRCDYPQNVLCLRSSAIVKSTKSVEKQSGLSTVTTALANKKCQIVNILGWKKDVLLPHWNCDNFFQCANGVAVQRVCPSGLLFNVATDTCDYPQNVKCFRQNHADDQSSADDRSLATALADSKCLVANVLGVKNDVLFAHWDCDKYYICDNGAAVARPCPAGLHFNTFTDRCDYPQNVLCLRSSAIVKSTKSVEKQSGLSTVTTALANKKCQIVNILGWKKDVLLPHWNCDNFFQCANGVAVQRVCPSGLLFNVATDTCDYPQNVKCFRENHADNQSSADDRSLATALADSKCLVANVLGVKNDVLFAHWDCDKYYICDNGAAVARPCPAGLHFNTFTDSCDYPQNVKCFRF